ncbi:MAG: restriction endonuclease subunit R [Candidatus Abyssobacteria bacterium SURF_5]|uniref:Restriction endonuclease subunit R n=1 Tax=Abyssobacteria bacterium (strain SURF_5) TaxID=2093360 RepID=A0A3A4P6R1_ABYX5|nr:MAG: restriction endonuclease subunit R [Candidatus Abyssubacteria bacterium SURF_5]
MISIPKAVAARFVSTVPKFQRILQIARDRDVNEADTVAIVQDILSEVMGFDKYLEITSEYCIRGTFCDLAIKMGETVQNVIEVKAIGLTLKENHLRQAVDYCANHGAQWAVLTNGINWELYKIRFEQPIQYDLVYSFNFLELSARKAEDQEKLFILSKEGLARAARETFYEKIQSVNRFIIGALLRQESVFSTLRRDLKKLTPGLRIRDEEIEKILLNEVLKRDIIEGEEASKALSRVRRTLRKVSKQSSKPKGKLQPAPTLARPAFIPASETFEQATATDPAVVTD